MAAIFEPHRLPSIEGRRPELRLVHGGLRSVEEQERLRPAALVAGFLLALLLVIGAVAVGRGALAGLAPAPPAPASAPATAAAGAGAGAATVEVQAGDTLWSIATALQPEGDVRALVDELIAANGAGPLVPGQVLTVPS